MRSFNVDCCNFATKFPPESGKFSMSLFLWDGFLPNHLPRAHFAGQIFVDERPQARADSRAADSRRPFVRKGECPQYDEQAIRDHIVDEIVNHELRERHDAPTIG
jgi:hypothetical protein